MNLNEEYMNAIERCLEDRKINFEGIQKILEYLVAELGVTERINKLIRMYLVIKYDNEDLISGWGFTKDQGIEYFWVDSNSELMSDLEKITKQKREKQGDDAYSLVYFGNFSLLFMKYD